MPPPSSRRAVVDDNNEHAGCHPARRRLLVYPSAPYGQATTDVGSPAPARQHRGDEPPARWLQVGAFACYLLAAVTAIASEGGRASVNLHRPFSFLAQVCIVVAILVAWKHRDRRLLWLNCGAWAGILADTALHFLLR